MITASLTTLPQRRESLKDTIESLLPQVDRLNVYLHGYTDLPDFLDDPKIELAMDFEWGDHGDLDKFHWCKELTEGYHFLCDDDLIYPPDYVEKMLRGFAELGDDKVLSFHGCTPLKLPIVSYYDDRIGYPCLGNVSENTRVYIPGTGVMAYHTSIGFKGFEGDMFPNMADIYMATWAAENDKDVFVLKHPEGWIKHSEKVDLNDTIAVKNRYNTFQQVNLINSRPDLFQVSMGGLEYPLVSVVVINSRMKTHPHYVKDCFDSIRAQYYPAIEPIIIENFERTITIGRAYNKGIEQAKGKYVLFLGDDDFITEDYVSSMVAVIEALRRKDENVKGITSYLTMFYNGNTPEAQAREVRELTPTGMWLREFMLEHKFVEYLTKLVDSEFIDRVRAQGFILATAVHHYGYYYRSHPGQVSGFKSFTHEKDTQAHDIVKLHRTVKEFAHENI